VLKGEDRIELRKEPAAPAKSERKRKAAETSSVVNVSDVALLAALKALRAKLAQTQKVPAYVVFSDRTLIELARHRPENLSAMREIHGIGDAKLERYGPAFLDVIKGDPAVRIR
jgi:ATP-dependent DNA helicase RecQ